MPETPLRPADDRQAERLHTFAHDIKNRIGSLWEAIRLLRTGPVEGVSADELLAFAERGFFHAQRDLEDLLDDFGVERGIKAGRAAFSLKKSVSDALANEGFRLRKKGQSVELRGPDDPLAQGDGPLTTQLIQALISNASKFSPKGAVISVDLAASADTCTVRVTDRGCGLSNEDLALVFKRYTILASRGTDGEPQSRGTLARAWQWAKAQNGSLEASSMGLGHGCVFTLRLPTA